MYLIETERLGLRKLTLDDAQSLYQILSDKETMRFYPSPYSHEQVNGWIQRNMDSYNKNRFGLWAVILKETKQFIGQCGISIQDIDGELVPEIGYHINKEFWKKGFATEASKGCLLYGFQKLQFPTIYIHTYVKNIPSQRVAEKLGMTKVKAYHKHIQLFGVVWEHFVYKKTNKYL